MDAELDHLLAQEAADRLLVISGQAQRAAEALAGSLHNAADALDRLAAASQTDEERRAGYRRRECPGRFDP